jgi:hypothetical protein
MGRTLGEGKVNGIDAPTDLKPRTAKVTFSSVGKTSRLIVKIDPEDELEEITVLNNSAGLSP